MKTFKQFSESFRPAAYYKVVKPITVFRMTGGSGLFTKYGSLKLRKGDEIHVLPGGTFAVSGDDKSYGDVEFTNPNKDSEAQHHSRKGANSMESGALSQHLKKNALKKIDKSDAFKVAGPKYRG